LARMDIQVSDQDLRDYANEEEPFFETQDDQLVLGETYKVLSIAGVRPENFARRQEHILFFGTEPYEAIMQFYARSLYRVCFRTSSHPYYVFSYGVLVDVIRANDTYGTQVDFTSVMAVRFLVYHNLVRDRSCMELWDLAFAIQNISLEEVQKALVVASRFPSGIRDPFYERMKATWEPYFLLRKQPFTHFLKSRPDA
jgi:hypothetical protein